MHQTLLSAFPVPLDIGTWDDLRWACFFNSVTPAGFFFPELVLKHVPPAFRVCGRLCQAQPTTAWGDLALFGSTHLPASLDACSFPY